MDVDVLEQELADLSERLTGPLPGECLWHYLDRMLDQYGCAAHRFTRRWAVSRSRGTPDGLVRWAAQRGGCCCDCEVVMNSLRSPKAASQRAGVLCASVTTWMATPEGCRDDDCLWVECEDASHGARAATPAVCAGLR